MVHETHGQASLTCVAYFSMEFMLSEALPIYSGGLGNVAGDQLKAASDLGVPVVGVGLLYQQGYFRQVIDRDGAQQALFPYNDPGQLPITPLRDANGEWLRLEIALPGFSVWMRAWQVQVGRVKLYLLDSNDAANFPAHRGITSELYGGDRSCASSRSWCSGSAAGGCWTRWVSSRKSAISTKGTPPSRCWNAPAASWRKPASRSRPRWPRRGRGISSRRIRRWRQALTASHRPLSSNIWALCEQKLGISIHDLLALGRADPNDAPSLSTWPTWPSAAAAPSTA